MLFFTAAAISNAYATTYGLYSNPQFKNAGKFMALRDFLALAYNTSSVSGVLIIIEAECVDLISPRLVKSKIEREEFWGELRSYALLLAVER
ncbi:hypothetical protein RHMOL_Rhmol02G0154700 [Rhododendron molle]|uniref:Uncharacterized protein n=1 Tax=Rhododendron molle TaxID=49168 RepID=A0ACC0PQK3_RHOML|nr:hypothetical protein RHMOL_Rhmol02G0154700 [Rhododendron molle]